MQPWLHPFNNALCGAVLGAVQRGEDCLNLLNAQSHALGLCNMQGMPLRFVQHNNLPADVAYEQYIFDTACVPTRTLAGSKGAMHDACNALMWLHWPRTKSVLNALQAAAIAADGVQATRGALRDALTLFDESALIVCCPADDNAPEQLAQRRWQDVLLQRRNDWHATLKPLLFGHAVLQKLQAPYPAITAQVWVLHGEHASDLNTVDKALAASLHAAHTAHTLTSQAFLPLPILGIPNWWAANADAAFYDNVHVFRPLPKSCDSEADLTQPTQP